VIFYSLGWGRHFLLSQIKRRRARAYNNTHKYTTHKT
jgi:hypothetical protein